MNKILLPLLPLIVFIGCSDFTGKDTPGDFTSKSERCKCHLNINEAREVFDSLQTNSTQDSKHNPSIKIDLPEKFKKYIEAELSYEYEKNGQSLETQIIVKKIVDKYPEITNFSSMKKEFYCAFVRNICADTTLTDGEVILIKNEKLEVIDKLFEKIYLEKMKLNLNNNKGNSPLTKKKESDFYIYSKELDFVMLEQLVNYVNRSGATSNHHNPKNRIDIIIEKNFSEVPNSTIYYQLENINLKILLNEKFCLKIPIDLSKEFKGISGGLETMKKQAQSHTEKWINENLLNISKHITSCLQ